jgi:hypothetical protein
MDAEHDRQVGDAEAAGAAAGMAEVYGRVFAVGDTVSGVSCGKRFTGQITQIDGEWLTLEPAGAWLRVRASEVTL